MTLEMTQIALRISVAGLIGAAVGFERELNRHHAGMRTNSLVSIGAALFTIVGTYGFRTRFGDASIDPTRVSAQIVSGIGFIGAGAIIREGASVRGITTAAALWTSAALGMAAGAGQYPTALVGLVLVLVTLTGLRAVRDRGVHRLLQHEHGIEVAYQRGHGTLRPLLEAVRASGAVLVNLVIDDSASERRVRLTLRTRDSVRMRDQLERIAGLPEVTQVAADGASLLA